MEGKDSPWISEKATTTSKIESQSTSIATNIGIWQKIVERRKRRKPGSASNVTRKNTLLGTVKKNSQ